MRIKIPLIFPVRVLCALRLFFKIVFRQLENPKHYAPEMRPYCASKRIGPVLAWRVAWGIWRDRPEPWIERYREAYELANNPTRWEMNK